MSDQDSDEDVNQSNAPASSAEAQKLVDGFVSVTKTNQALAQFFLQENKWILVEAIEEFFKQLASEAASISKPTSSSACPFPGTLTNIPPDCFNIISWNIDGLDEVNSAARIGALTSFIFSDCPDIVLLQEVIPKTLQILTENLPEYKIIKSNTSGYFNVTMLRVFTVKHDSDRVQPLCHTIMDRKVIIVEAHIGKMKLALLNTHLESTKDYAANRVKQLQECYSIADSFPEDVSVIFSGDLNIRDKELSLAGGIPPGFLDLWECTGKRKEVEFTWDLRNNTNKQMPGSFQPRLRFDRMYLKHAHPKVLVPEHFGFVGIEKVPKTQSYISDHWGIKSYFKITSN